MPSTANPAIVSPGLSGADYEEPDSAAKKSELICECVAIPLLIISAEKIGSRLSRIFKPLQSRAGATEAASPDEPQTAAQKRRQQVYQAQK